MSANEVNRDLGGQLGMPSAQPTRTEGRILAGFMKDRQVENFAFEMLAGASADVRRAFRASVDAARRAAAQLPAEDLSKGVVQPLDPVAEAHVASLRSDPAVTGPFLGQGWSLDFGVVDLTRVVCLQGCVMDSAEVPPRDQVGMLRFALPVPTPVPCDVTVAFDKPPNLPPPITGHATFLGDVPYLNSLAISFANGQLIFGSPTHVNLIQVAEHQGRYYLRNGYHRAALLLRNGVVRAPAAIVSGLPPNYQMGGADMIPLEEVVSLVRPPLIKDLLGPAAIPFWRRKKRTGKLLRFEAYPTQVPM